MPNITIAIDGFSSCGKSTLAKEIAEKLQYSYVDSGAMYRAVTLYLLNKGILKDGSFIKSQVLDALPNINISFEINPDKKRSETHLNGNNVEKEIRKLHVAQHVSAVSAIPEVRTKLVAMQQNFGQNGAVVMDGRDIGTVVFPRAEVKLFMTASKDIRAQRRYDELLAKGDKVNLDEIRQNLVKRDYIDMNRDVSPLKKAEDAIEIDNSELTREEQLDLALNIIQKAIDKSTIEA
ncbi:MAG: (d)CMP kinase [Crocinitomicaceae bacterium]|nr:(d)CMP kinase [Crocinitomicaceae bacterium]